MTDNQQTALKHAARGWAVFPCGNDKRPLTAHGFKDATTDPETIRAWWATWPGALVGLPCERNGFFVLDVDRKPGKPDGFEALAALTQERGETITPGITQDTPSGGAHYLWALPDGVKIPNNAGKLSPGLDLRSAGYVCTGSLPDGSGYTWLPGHSPDEHPMTACPDWLIEIIRKMGEKTPPPTTTKPQGSGNGHKPGEIGAFWLAKALSLATEGTRNDTGFWLACQLRDAGLSQSDAENVLSYYAGSVPGDGYTEREALASCESAYQQARRDPARSLSGNGHHPGGEYIPPEPEPPPDWELTQEQDTMTTTEPTTAPQGTLTGWQPYTLRDAYQDRPPVAYVVGKLFELPSVNVVYGAPGCLKSFLLADLAGCIAGGAPWLTPAPGEGGEGQQVTPGPVVWLDFDNGRRRTHDRFSAIGRALKLPEDCPLYYFSMPSPWLDGANKNQVGELGELIKSYGAHLVVIDNLGAVTPTVDENSAEMIAVFAHFRWLAEHTGAAIVVIHHQRKSNGFKTRKGETMRGHSGIEAALDLAILVERSEEQRDNLIITATKTRGVEVHPFGAIFAVENRPDGELNAARFFGKRVESQELVMVSTIRAAILASLAAGEEVTKAELTNRAQANLSKVGINRIRDAITMLIEQGYLQSRDGPKHSILISKTAFEDTENDD